MSEQISADVARRFLDQARHYLNDEYRAKLLVAVPALTTEQVWWRPNPSANSVGTLLLHLAGNIRQWIVSGVGGAPDVRDRAAEFNAREGPTGTDLLAALNATLDEVDRVLASLPPETLLERRHIQGRDLLVLDAVFHVVEHFSYHVGQIVMTVKALEPGTIQFYEDAGGLARPTWKSVRRN